MVTILDGPVGSLLADFGVETPEPLWSAEAIEGAPGVVARIHEAYATAGARVHTANTFRTKERQAGAAWELYDLKTDVGEEKNVAAAQADVLKRIDALCGEAHTPERKFGPGPKESAADYVK